MKLKFQRLKPLLQVFTKKEKHQQDVQDTYPAVSYASVHHIGNRPYQEDSWGVLKLKEGCLAVAADGMGGLSGGDKVSRKIVDTMLEYGANLNTGQIDGILAKFVKKTNQEVNRMLGPDGIYKSGSTLLAVLIQKNCFQWISVGDSRIYLYRDDELIKLNQEHNLAQELIIKAVRGEMSFEEAKNHPDRNKLTSFIGMGDLRYIDQSMESIELKQGDRIVLATDGVFNTLSDEMIVSAIRENADVNMIAKELESLVLEKKYPRQDNFTAIVLMI